MEKENSVEINLVDLFYFVRKRVWAIIVTAILAAVAVFVVCRFFVTPQYVASTRMYVLNNLSSSSASSGELVYSDFQIANLLVKDYEVLITGRNVTSVVIEELGLDLTNAELASKVTVSSPNSDGTRVLQINVRDADPERAALIANSVREQAEVQIKELMKVDSISKIYDAIPPTAPSTPNTFRNTVIGGVIGALIAFVVLFIIFMMDDRIKTEEDVERYLKLNTIGIIPYCEEIETATPGAAGNKKKKKKSGPTGRVPGRGGAAAGAAGSAR